MASLEMERKRRADHTSLRGLEPASGIRCASWERNLRMFGTTNTDPKTLRRYLLNVIAMTLDCETLGRGYNPGEFVDPSILELITSTVDSGTLKGHNKITVRLLNNKSVIEMSS